MDNLAEGHAAEIMHALKEVRSYDPDKIMPEIEDGLLPDEAKEIEAFLSWCFVNRRPYGAGSIERRFLEFKEAVRDDGSPEAAARS